MSVKDINKALDLVMYTLLILQRISGMSDEEVLERKKEAEKKSDDLLKQLR